MEAYKNIPGMLTEFRDGGLQLKNDGDANTTKSVLILGTAVDGYINEPVAVSVDTVRTVFGSDVHKNGVPNGATIPKAVDELYRAGCRDIRVLRYTGSQATTTITNQSKNVNVTKKMVENLDYVKGNEETELVLGRAGIIANTIKVYAKGAPLSTNISYDQEAKKITIPADITDAGIPLIVRYEATETQVNKAITQKLTVNSEKKITLKYTPKQGEEIVLKLNGVEIDSEEYEIATNVVTFDNVAAGSAINAFYKADVETVVQVSQSETTGGVPFKTATGTQEFTLADVPNLGTLHVYADGSEVLSEEAISTSGNKLTIAKEYFSKGELISTSYFADDTQTVTEGIKVSSIFGGSIYNEAVIDIEEIKNGDNVSVGRKVILTKPSSKRSTTEAPLEYSSINYPTFRQLVEAINNDIRNGVFKLSTDHNEALTGMLQAGRYFLSGGDDGLNASKEEIFTALSGRRNASGELEQDGVYQLLENYKVDFVVLTGVYADDELSGRYDNFAYELALFCGVVSYRNKTTYGYISMSPCRDTSLAGLKAYAEKLAAFNANKNLFLMKNGGSLYMNNDGSMIDLGMYVRVVAGPDPMYLSDTLGRHAADPATVAAGDASSRNSNSSPANKRLEGSKGLRYNFSNSQLDAITGAGIITFKQKYDPRGNLLEGAYFVDSMTCALPGSDYIRTTTCEVVRDCVDDVREVCDPFIGQPNTPDMQNAMGAAISKRLAQRKEHKYLQDFSFSIIATDTDRILGQAKIELSLVPPQELRKLTTVVGLRPTV